MASRLYLLVVAAWTGWAASQDMDYCKFTSEHTACKFSGRGPRCGPQVRGSGVSSEDAAVIVALHNELRSKVARGEETRGAPGPQPSGANMRALAWDEELATVAQRHADQCVFEHECPDCRRVDRFGVGQNLFISFQSNLDLRIQWSRAILSWFDEVADFPNTSIHPYQFSQATGHYTQMLWWDTALIGCGFTMFLEDGWWKKLYTCNYGPAGNIIFSQMYLLGAPCSACPAGTSCSLQYPGLCEGDADVNSTSVASSTILPPTPAEDDINTILGDFKGFTGLINLNSITPNDVDLQALVEFFNNLRRTNLITAPTTTPIGGQATTATPTSPVPPSTETAAPTTVDTTTTSMTATTEQPLEFLSVTTKSPLSTSSASITASPPPPQDETVAPFVTSQVASSSPILAVEPEAEQIMSVLEALKASEEGTHMESSEHNHSGLTLMSILMRAGRNTQVIRTSSLNNVHEIIQGLPPGVDPIVVLRSRSGELTELDPTSLTPRRAHRSASNPARLLTCDMDMSPCTMSLAGGNWTVMKSLGEGHHAEIELAEGDKTQIIVKKVVKAPPAGTACVAFTHRRDVLSTDPDTTAAAATTAAADNTIPELQVGVMPLGRQATHKAVLGVPGRWEMSRSTFRDLNSPFVVVVSVGPAASPAKFALDALMVTDGPCCLSGRC
ncbi:uncharacterized protein LOC135090578 isoform X2 [Scylla paramamosain]